MSELLLAIKARKLTRVRALLKQGDRSFLLPDPYRRGPVYQAYRLAQFGSGREIEIFGALLDAGAGLVPVSAAAGSVPSNSSTAATDMPFLMSAVLLGADPGLVVCLLDHGADPHGYTHEGKTAWQWARANSNRSLIEVFEAWQRARIEVVDEDDQEGDGVGEGKEEDAKLLPGVDRLPSTVSPSPSSLPPSSSSPSPSSFPSPAPSSALSSLSTAAARPTTASPASPPTITPTTTTSTALLPPTTMITTTTKPTTTISTPPSKKVHDPLAWNDLDVSTWAQQMFRRCFSSLSVALDQGEPGSCVVIEPEHVVGRGSVLRVRGERRIGFDCALNGSFSGKWHGVRIDGWLRLPSVDESSARDGDFELELECGKHSLNRLSGLEPPQTARDILHALTAPSMRVLRSAAREFRDRMEAERDFLPIETYDIPHKEEKSVSRPVVPELDEEDDGGIGQFEEMRSSDKEVFGRELFALQ